MHVLVTGGAGFIGSHSTEALLAAGAKVTVLDNFSAGKRSNLPTNHANLRIVEGDIRDAAVVAAAVSGITHVLHLAAQVSVQSSVSDPVNSGQHNITGFLNVMDAARRAGLVRVTFAAQGPGSGNSASP